MREIRVNARPETVFAYFTDPAKMMKWKGIVRLRHYNLPSTEAQDQHAHGWEHYLARLELAGSGQDPGKDPWVGQPDAHSRT